MNAGTNPDMAAPLERWFRPEVDRAVVRDLSRRTNWHGALHAAAWFSLVGGLAWLAVDLWWSWWVIPVLLVYGNVVALGAIAMEHEALHGTFLKARWANEALAHIGGFLCGLEAIRYRWTHHGHHSHTLSTVQPRDWETLSQLAVGRTAIALNLLPFGGLVRPKRNFWYWHRETFNHARGKLSWPVRDGVPERIHPVIIRNARIHAAIWLAAVAASVVLRNPLPVLLLVVQSWYGATLFLLCGLTQHAALPPDVRDHRRNTRSFTTNPVLRFLYFGMELHLEHHLFPQVPSRNLRKLQAELGSQLPAPRQGLVGAWREVLPALNRRATDPTYFVDVPVPRPAART